MSNKNPIIILTLVGLLSTALVAITHYISAPKIVEQEKRQFLNIIDQVLDKQGYNNTIIDSCRVVVDPLLGDELPHPIYIAKKNNQPIATVFNSTTHKGYNGEIKLVIAIYQSGKIAGVRVLSHSETPGLGDKIDIRKSDWITAFNDQSLSAANQSQWAVTKDGGKFDAFTGATITPRALVAAVKQTLILQQTLTPKRLSALPDCNRS